MAHVFDEDNGLWFCSDSEPGTGEAGGAHTLEARLFCSPELERCGMNRAGHVI